MEIRNIRIEEENLLIELFINKKELINILFPSEVNDIENITNNFFEKLKNMNLQEPTVVYDEE